MTLKKHFFSLFLGAIVTFGMPQKAQANAPLALLGVAATGAALTGAGYLEWKSIKDETSDKTWNRAGWTAASLMPVPVLNWYFLYRAVKGIDWGKRFCCKLGSRTLLLAALGAATGTFYALNP